MQHKFSVDDDGDLVIVGEAPGFPYCMYVECIYCGEWFCHNSCDKDEIYEECPEAFETLFEWEHLLKVRSIYDD